MPSHIITELHKQAKLVIDASCYPKFKKNVYGHIIKCHLENP